MDRSKFVHDVHNSEGGLYGTTTDIYLLPVGTLFHVENGIWNGLIIEKEGKKFIQTVNPYGEAYEENEPMEIKENVDYGMVITIKNLQDEAEGVYRHYKGGIYTILKEATHTENEEKLIIYLDEEGNVWARPREMFFGKLEYLGHEVKRFTRIR